jgi:hypothetical protein
MPGLSTITGLIPCSNSRYVFSEKPRTVTVDTEIVIGVDENGDVNTAPALLQHFTPVGAPAPVNGALHFVFGKVASMESSVVVGDGFSQDEYDFVVDADVVCNLPVPCPFHS